MDSRTRLRAPLLTLVFTLVAAAHLAAQTGATAPILPRENPNIVFVEGEDALSTNFASEPTLNYSASGKRTLQLSSLSDVQGDSGYYADYVFYVPESGDYELWYAGTPAGPLDDLYPSFFSPIRYRLDGGEPVAVYREDIVVNENYAPSFYWNRVKPMALEAGVHRLRFEVKEKRRYDNRYYFYLDAFFLIRVVEGSLRTGEPLPTLFPRDLTSTAIDRPFRSIDDYLVIVSQATERTQRVSRQVELATVYSMVGDYANALRYLSRAALLEPDSPAILLLQAKNQIWKGDLGDGIATYRKLLELSPGNPDLWVEAGKIAAWTSRYDDSVDLLGRGLEKFPDNLDLMVNLGLTYLWSSRLADADRLFRASLQTAKIDLDRLKYLADVYRVNGYTDRAVAVYRQAIDQEPADLESYLLLESALRKLDRESDADGVRQTIQSTFLPSAELDRYLATYRIQQSLIQATIEEYEASLAATPDNLELRQLLAQTYFWNGFQEQAVDEYLNILVNHAYRQLREMDTRAAPLYQALDTGYLLNAFLIRAPEMGKQARAALEAAGKDLERALAEVRKAEEAARKAAETGAENAADLAAQVEPRAALVDEKVGAAGLAVGKAEALLTLLDRAQGVHEDWLARIEGLKGTLEEERTLFADVIKASRWTWDRKAALAEAAAQAAKGLTIAHYVTARVAQIDRRYTAAYPAWGELGETDPVYTYGRAQTALWEGKQGSAAYVELLGSLPAEAVTYRDSMIEVADVLGLTGVLGEESPALLTAQDAATAVAQTVADLAQRLGAAETMRRGLPIELRGAHRMLADTLVREYYRFEERTVTLRNELGDFYLKGANRVAAIRQYRYVLGIDPTNLDAMFRLGSTSSLAGDWSEALRYYERVWSADPLFENVASLYNRIAQEHGDSLSVSGVYTGEPTRVTWTGSARYTLPLASLLGIQAGYQVASNRSTYSLPNAYDVQTVSVGLPVSVYPIGLTVTPRAGVDLVATFVGDLTTGPLGLLLGQKGYPYGGVDVDLALPNALRVQGTFRAGTYTQTLAQIVSRPSLSGSLGISPVLASLDVPVIRDVYLRSYGELAVLPAVTGGDANLVWLVAQDLVIPLRWSTPVSPTLSIEGAFYYTDSIATEAVWEYYSPQEAITAKGGLTGTLTLPAGRERIGLSLRAAGGYTRSYDMLTAAQVSSALVEGNLGVTLSRRAGALGLRAAFSGAIGLDTSTLDYWSLTVALEYTVGLARLLLPR